MKILNDLTKYSTISGVLIIILSYIHHYLFYREFNIDIINYVNFSELLTLFLRNSIIILVTLILVIFLFFYTKITKKLLSNKFSNYIIPLIFIFIFLFMLINAKMNLTGYKLNIEIAQILFIFLIFILFSLALRIFINNLFSINTRLVIFIGIAIIFTISNSKLEAYKIKYGTLRNSYTIILKNTIINTDNNLIRIGQTQNYFFLYNRQNRTSKIIKSENINEILVSSK